METAAIMRMKELVQKLDRAAKAYYQQDTEIISNREYDQMYDELQALEKETGTVLGQADLGAAGAFVPQRGFCRQFHCHAVRGIHRAGTVSSPMSGCCNGRCHVPHIGAAVPPASGTVGSLPGPAFPCHADPLGMVLPAGHLY